MPRRLPCVDEQRGAAVDMTLEGSPVRGFAGESVAAALFAGGTRVMSRSLKYHRPRGFFCMSGHCSGCLVRIDGVPNLRACQIACAPGQAVEVQNAYPSAELDLLGAVDFLFPRLDHHTLMTGSSVLNNLASKVVRQLSGLGKIPERAPDEIPEVRRAEVDVAVIGGGPAGLAAATAAAKSGARTVLIDDQLRPGGCMLVDPRYGVGEADRRVHAARSAGVAILSSSTAIAFYPEDDGGLLAVATPTGLVRVTARRFVYATGGYPVNLLFGDNDRPGVVAARGVGRLLVQHAVLAGDRVCIVEGEGQADYAAALAEALHAAGAEVVRVPADDVERSKGRGWVKSLDRTSGGRVDCDVVAVAAVPAPASEAPRQHGCHVVLDPSRGGFRVVVDEHGQTSVGDVLACGDVCGYMGPAAATQMGARVGATAATAALAARTEAAHGL